MGKNLVKAYPLRLNEDLKNKVKFIAYLEKRKLSDQLYKIISEYVENYETEKGIIIPDNFTIEDELLENKAKGKR